MTKPTVFRLMHPQLVALAAVTFACLVSGCKPTPVGSGAGTLGTKGESVRSALEMLVEFSKRPLVIARHSTPLEVLERRSFVRSFLHVLSEERLAVPRGKTIDTVSQLDALLQELKSADDLDTLVKILLGVPASGIGAPLVAKHVKFGDHVVKDGATFIAAVSDAMRGASAEGDRLVGDAFENVIEILQYADNDIPNGERVALALAALGTEGAVTTNLMEKKLLNATKGGGFIEAACTVPNVGKVSVRLSRDSYLLLHSAKAAGDSFLSLRGGKMTGGFLDQFQSLRVTGIYTPQDIDKWRMTRDLTLKLSDEQATFLMNLETSIQAMVSDAEDAANFARLVPSPGARLPILEDARISLRAVIGDNGTFPIGYVLDPDKPRKILMGDALVERILGDGFLKLDQLRVTQLADRKGFVIVAMGGGMENMWKSMLVRLKDKYTRSFERATKEMSIEIRSGSEIRQRYFNPLGERN